jgi:hypothetical protein
MGFCLPVLRGVYDGMSRITGRDVRLLHAVSRA